MAAAAGNHQPAALVLKDAMSHRTRIKICGLTRADDVRAAVAAGADAIGLVFYPQSPRYVTPQQAAELIRVVPPFVTCTGLFVNASPDEVAAVTSIAPLAWYNCTATRRWPTAPPSPPPAA